MAKVHKCGLMVPSMKVNGKIIKLMERVNFGMQTEISTKESGKMTRLMVKVSTYMLMAQDMKVTGETIYKMAME